ncbi:MAG: amidohydrolase family protein [Mycobacterium sp.]
MSVTGSGASILVRNGRAFQANGFVVDGDVLVEDGKIRAVGPDAAAAAAPGVAELDARGGLVAPGFQDAHVHPFHGGSALMSLDLSQVGSGAECLAAIGAYAQANPDKEWIRGANWALGWFDNGLPTRQMLDSVVPDRPAYMRNRDGHGAWFNTRAMEIAGITADTPDPFEGRIEHTADGEVLGMVQELAMNLITDHIPRASDAEMDEGFRRANDVMLSWGITAWQDAQVGASKENRDQLDAYIRASHSGVLRSHVVGALRWTPERGLEQIDDLLERRERSFAANPNFRATTVKIFQDGIAENFTAAMLSPYLDCCGNVTSNSGRSWVDPELLKEAVAALAAHDFQVHFHSLGDRAVRESLDAVEYAREKHGEKDLRHTLSHIQVVHPDDVPRFAELDVVANCQPLWARHEEQIDVLTTPYLGPRRNRWQYPFAAIQRTGGKLAIGSDWPVSTGNVVELLHTAVNRSGVAAKGEDPLPFLGEQALSLNDSLVAATEGVAYLNHDEHRSGSLEIGKDGDIVVLDRDVFDRPLAEIGESAVDYTIIGGDIVFERN